MPGDDVSSAEGASAPASSLPPTASEQCFSGSSRRITCPASRTGRTPAAIIPAEQRPSRSQRRFWVCNHDVNDVPRSCMNTPSADRDRRADNECTHEMCLEYYSHAAVRENGDSLCCPLRRNASSVSVTTANPRHEHGDEAVSRAFDAAQRGRDSVLSNSRATLRGQAHQAPTYCDICQGRHRTGCYRQHTLRVPLSRRCAVGHVEDRLQRALDTCSDRIESAHPVQHAGAHNPSIGALLPEVTRLESSEGEEAE